MEPVIDVQHIGKEFILAHNAPEKYTTLRDTIARSGKRIFSFSRSGEPAGKPTKEVFKALNDVSFSIQPGERVGIIGGNGAGKSTLLKVLSRISEPTTGRITLRGRVASLLEVGTGFHPELTGRENIFLNGAVLGMSRVEIRKKFDEIVAFAEVERFLDTPVKYYSSGMYVRLAFAVAAHLEPEILIVDEVLAVGDAQFQKKCLGKMEDVSKNEGRTVLFVSHNMGVVSQLCQKAIFLQKGKLVSFGEVGASIQTYLSMNTTGAAGFFIDADSREKKPNHIARFRTQDKNGTPGSDFVFTDSIYLDIAFRVNDPRPNLQIGIGLQDKIQSRIFTILREIGEFRRTPEGDYEGTLKLPSSLIAPNIYSFVVALWTKDGYISDIIDNVCPIKIHDSGTEHASYEGVDYGSVIIPPEWVS